MEQCTFCKKNNLKCITLASLSGRCEMCNTWSSIKCEHAWSTDHTRLRDYSRPAVPFGGGGSTAAKVAASSTAHSNDTCTHAADASSMGEKPLTVLKPSPPRNAKPTKPAKRSDSTAPSARSTKPLSVPPPYPSPWSAGSKRSSKQTPLKAKTADGGIKKSASATSNSIRLIDVKQDALAENVARQVASMLTEQQRDLDSEGETEIEDKGPKARKWQRINKCQLNIPQNWMVHSGCFINASLEGRLTIPSVPRAGGCTVPPLSLKRFLHPHCRACMRYSIKSLTES